MTRIQTVEEHIQELGTIEKKRQVPGLISAPHREVRYVEDKGEVPFETFFERLAWHVDPPLMKGGGALIEGCVLVTPTSRRFQAISYRGDIEGWRMQVRQGAAALQTTLGTLTDGELELDDGSSYKLDDCEVQFD